MDQRIDLLVGLTPIAQHLSGDRAMLGVGGRSHDLENESLVLQRVVSNR